MPKASGLSRNDRIKQLRKTIGPDGIKAASKLHAIDLDIIRYALITHPKRVTTTRLGKQIEKILDGLPKVEADSMRASLILAKTKLAKRR